MIGAALLVIAAAMLLVRLGWGGRRGAAAAGWALAALALVWLAQRGGAWGLATGAVTGMAAASAILFYAGWTSPAKARRPAREAPTVLLPRRWDDVARRIAVFVLVVPCAFAAAQWLAFGVQASARRAGAGEADAIVLTLFLQPILWVVIMSWQMTRSGAPGMIAPPVAAAALGTLLWGVS